MKEQANSRHATNRPILDVPGLGPAGRKRLLDHFGSHRAVLAATEDELTAVPGIGATLAARIAHIEAFDPQPVIDSAGSTPANGQTTDSTISSEGSSESEAMRAPVHNTLKAQIFGSEPPLAKSRPDEVRDFEVTDLTVTFGGLTAVDDLNLRAQAGTITALIGPNGAGKTTTFDAATGLLTPDSGTVRLGHDVLDGKPPSARAQRGLGRTFQQMELFDSMTVFENVALGPEALFAGRKPWDQILSSPSQVARIYERAEAALEYCGIADISKRSASGLSTGQRRLVELARVLASRFDFILLDEPSSGLDEDETESLAKILLNVTENEGVGILLVEHDMALVRKACTYTFVLDFGELIHEGITDDVLSSSIVRAAYLGEEAV